MLFKIEKANQMYEPKPYICIHAGFQYVLDSSIIHNNYINRYFCMVMLKLINCINFVGFYFYLLILKEMIQTNRISFYFNNVYMNTIMISFIETSASK